MEGRPVPQNSRERLQVLSSAWWLWNGDAPNHPGRHRTQRQSPHLPGSWDNCVHGTSTPQPLLLNTETPWISTNLRNTILCYCVSASWAHVSHLFILPKGIQWIIRIQALNYIPVVSRFYTWYSPSRERVSSCAIVHCKPKNYNVTITAAGRSPSPSTGSFFWKQKSSCRCSACQRHCVHILV